MHLFLICDVVYNSFLGSRTYSQATIISGKNRNSLTRAVGHKIDLFGKRVVRHCLFNCASLIAMRDTSSSFSRARFHLHWHKSLNFILILAVRQRASFCWRRQSDRDFSIQVFYKIPRIENSEFRKSAETAISKFYLRINS